MSDKKCFSCKKNIREIALYCPYCGKIQTQEHLCEKCGAVLYEDSKYCSVCGAGVKGRSRGSSPIVFKEDKLLKYSEIQGDTNIADYGNGIQEIYYKGVVAELNKQYVSARSCFEKAYSLHGYTGGFKYATYLWNISGDNSNKEVALAIYKDLAVKLHAKAMVMLGVIYMNGLSVRQDKETAIKWFAKAEKANRSELLTNMPNDVSMDPAILYGIGLYSEGNKEKAKEILEDKIYLTFTTDTYRNKIRAFLNELAHGKREYYGSDKEFAQLIQQEIFSSEENEAYENETGQPGNTVNTEKCYTKGYNYLYGNGVVQNTLKAMKWFIRGGQAGHGLCQYYAGYIYACGSLGEPDYVKCKYWYTLASKNGIQEATQYLSDYKDFFKNVDCRYVIEPTVTEEEINSIDYYRESILEMARDYGRLITLGGNVCHFMPNIPYVKLTTAIAGYAKGINPGDVVFMYDSTFSHNGKKGFIFTDKEIVSSFGVRLDYSKVSELMYRENTDGASIDIIALPNRKIIFQAYEKETIKLLVEKMNEYVFKPTED